MNQLANLKGDVTIKVDHSQFPKEFKPPEEGVDLLDYLPFTRGTFILENVPVANEKGDGFDLSLKLNYVFTFSLLGSTLNISIFTEVEKKELTLITEATYCNDRLETKTNHELVSREITFTLFRYFFTFMIFVATAEPERIKVKTTVKPNRVKNQGGKKRYSSVITITGVIKVREAVESEQVKHDRLRHVESWGVRGHMRTYKSGKSIWIKPHKKGNGESIKQTYVMGKKIV